MHGLECCFKLIALCRFCTILPNRVTYNAMCCLAVEHFLVVLYCLSLCACWVTDSCISSNYCCWSQYVLKFHGYCCYHKHHCYMVLSCQHRLQLLDLVSTDFCHGICISKCIDQCTMLGNLQTLVSQYPEVYLVVLLPVMFHLKQVWTSWQSFFDRIWWTRSIICCSTYGVLATLGFIQISNFSNLCMTRHAYSNHTTKIME